MGRRDACGRVVTATCMPSRSRRARSLPSAPFRWAQRGDSAAADTALGRLEDIRGQRWLVASS
eukprot:887980-Alexandrium_andersonii.AAC.1